MEQYIPKSALVTEIEKLKDGAHNGVSFNKSRQSMGLKSELSTWEHLENAFATVLKIIDTLEVKDPYEQCVQYDSIKAGIKAHAEEYSFNIESELFHQLTKEQQELWRKEIEQACISGGNAGIELARDSRYKESLEVKGVDLNDYYHKFLEKEWFGNRHVRTVSEMMAFTAKHFFELGMAVSNKAQKGE